MGPQHNRASSSSLQLPLTLLMMVGTISIFQHDCWCLGEDAIALYHEINIFSIGRGSHNALQLTRIPTKGYCTGRVYSLPQCTAVLGLMLADVWFAVKTWEKIWHFSESNKLLFGRCSIISDVSVIPACYCAFSGKKHTHALTCTHTHANIHIGEDTVPKIIYQHNPFSCTALLQYYILNI